MQKMLICLLALLLVSACGYNTLKTKEEQTDRAWNDLGFSCRQRIQLAGIYMDSVQRHVTVRNEVLLQAENAIMKANQEGCPLSPPESPQKFARFRVAQAELTQALAQLHMFTSSHPDLLKDPDFISMQKRMEQAEGRINESIAGYNFASHDFNVSKRSFPHFLTNVLLLRYKDKEPFMAEESVKLSPKIDS